MMFPVPTINTYNSFEGKQRFRGGDKDLARITQQQEQEQFTLIGFRFLIYLLPPPQVFPLSFLF